MPKTRKMIYILTIFGSIVALAVALGIQYLQDKNREEDKIEIIKNNNTNTGKVLDSISDLDTKIKELNERQKAFETYVKNSIDSPLEKILSEKGYTIEQIEKLANEAIQTSKNNFELGNAYFVKGDFQKAINNYEQSLVNVPSQIPTNIHFALGQAKLKLLEKHQNFNLISGITHSDVTKAVLKEIIYHFSIGIERIPNDFRAFHNRGIAYLELGEINKAEFDFEKSKLLNPSEPQPYINLAKTYILKNNSNYVNPALDLLDKAISLDPSYGIAYYNRGNIYELYFNDFEKAVQDYTSSIKYGFNDKHVYNNLGIAYTRWGKLDLAIESFQVALKIDSNFESAIKGLRNIEVLRKRKGP